MKNTFTLAHVGVNTENAEEALALAELLAGMFNLAPPRAEVRVRRAVFRVHEGAVSRQKTVTSPCRHRIWKAPLPSSKKKGFSFREETAAYDEAGKLKNIYLAGEYGGFAIHILRG